MTPQRLEKVREDRFHHSYFSPAIMMLSHALITRLSDREMYLAISRVKSRLADLLAIADVVISWQIQNAVGMDALLPQVTVKP